VQNTGHADFVEDARGNWWAVFLGVRPVRAGSEWKTSIFGKLSFQAVIETRLLITDVGRETFLAPMTWENDWPVVNGGRPITLHSEGPGDHFLDPPVKWRDDFTEPELGLGWY